ncbi:MAG: hypothetical protein HQL10_04825 [Nitrospirae bacterium]|nr:hypothetical protein [Nitrospirota bacterium]
MQPQRSNAGRYARKVAKKISSISISMAIKQQGLSDTVARLREIVPDISHQESSEQASFNDYLELKRRSLQSFQCTLMLKAIKDINKHSLMVVDIGDSAGTHMLYLKALTTGIFDVDTVSVNLDPRAIEKIRARGMTAMLCRAEDFSMDNRGVDLFTSFQMVEHLHNPALFFRRLAIKSSGNRMVVTVPYLKKSRVGLHHVRLCTQGKVYAEDEHIFELCPEDWSLLMLHAGWRVVYDDIYFQYPRLPFFNPFLSWYWRKTDYEGFWGCIIEKDTSLSDRYQDWED